MPLLKLQLTTPPADAEGLLKRLSSIIAEQTGKPEQTVMVTLQQADILMAGDAAPAAFADVRAIGGLDGATNGALAAFLCECLGEQCGIESNRIYINFTDVERSNWGRDGKTF